MKAGILYVVFNKWINEPETNEIPYKIGITKGSVEDRYYGLGLIMPGKFETLFAYKLNNFEKAEKSIHEILHNCRINGEWFYLNHEKIELIKTICKTMGGKDITHEIENEIKHEMDNENNSYKYKTSETYDETQEVKKIERKIAGWFLNREQKNSKILYAFIYLHEQNNGIVTFEKLKEKANVQKFKGNFDQMKNFGKKNHGKIFDQVGQNIYLWEEVKEMVWNYYNKNIKKASNGT